MILVALLLAAAPPGQQEARDDIDIVVTGRGLPDAPGDTASSIVTIDRDAILANASARLESVLADVAGLQQFRRSDSRSANPTSQGISLRGIGGNASSRALLILDGVPQADPFGGWVAFPAYATDRLGRIRVTRGGGSGYFGPGALAGTVELDSAGPADLAPFQADLAYGSRNSLDAGGAATLVRSGGFASVSGSYARGDGFVPIVAASRGPADRPAPYAQASGAIRGVIDIGGSTELQANVAAFTDLRERGAAFTDNSSEGADASIRLVGRGRWGWSALGYLQTRNFASSFASISADRATATQTLDQYSAPATGIGGRIELAPPLGEALSLRVGGDVRDVRGRTQELFTFVAALPTRSRVAGGGATTYGLFADGGIAAGSVTVTLGGRIDAWRIAEGYLIERPIAGGAALTDARVAGRSGNEATGRAGIAWQPGAIVTLRAAAYRGWRLPTLNELYRPFRVGADATAANATLAPERLTGVEAGFALTPARSATLSATIFHNRLDGAIANVTAGRGPGNFPGVGFVTGDYRVRRNLDAIRVTGFEIDASWRGGPVGVRAALSHVDPRVIASGLSLALDQLRPAQTPRDQLSATADWRRGDAVAAVTVRHSARQFEDDQNVRSLAPATTIDAYAALPLDGGLIAELRGENLLDATVEAAVGATGVIERATPRTVWIGVRYRLN